MDLIKLTIEEHLLLLEKLGYRVDMPIEEIPNYKNVPILKKNRKIGDITYEEKNMFYLFRDDRIVGNRDLSKINFNKSRRKNYRGVIHVRLHDYNFKFNGYNQLLNITDLNNIRDYISFTDNETYRITKRLDKELIEVESLIEEISDDEILDVLRKPNKTLKLK